MLVVVRLVVGMFTGAVLWAVTGFFVTLHADLRGEWCVQMARGLLVPGAVVGGILFVAAPLALPPGPPRASALALGLGALGGLGLGAPAGLIVDYLAGWASTGLLPSFMLPLCVASVVLGAAGAWFGGWRTSQPPRQCHPAPADGVAHTAEPGTAADRGG